MPCWCWHGSGRCQEGRRINGLIHVVGIGLDGATGLSQVGRQLVETATLLVGSVRHLDYFSSHPAQRVVLGEFTPAIAQIRQHLSLESFAQVVVLTSGDPLFFGLGRLLLLEFPPEQLTFHPHLSSVQLAFSRVKLPWQDAQIFSGHGRSLDELMPLLQQGVSPLAILTDATNTPAAIARVLAGLDLPTHYRIWVCENLGGRDEQITETSSDRPHLSHLSHQTFSPLNVVILCRIDPPALPSDTIFSVLGIPDQAFLSFPDRPGLMTKREVRMLALAELALQPDQVIWDIGAGTGSVAIEIARLCPSSRIFAIEKTAVGFTLIQQNCQRFQVTAVQPIQGIAPAAVRSLPDPDRVFIGGSGGNLTAILDECSSRLKLNGRIVLALTTLEHLTATLNWLKDSNPNWHHHLLQVNLSRSVPIANLTRWTPLNPVTLLIIYK